MVVLLTLGSTIAAGCFMKRADGERLTEESTSHEERIVALEESLESERERLGQAVSEAQTKVTELEQVLQRATEVVTRNSADVGAEVQELRAQLATLEGQLAELQNELTGTQRQVTKQGETLEKRVKMFARKAGVDMTLEDSEIPAEAAAHYQAAETAYQAGNHSRARALFRAYVTRHGADERADNAQYFIGQSYLAQEQPARALGELQKVIRNYASGDAVDDALLAMGDAFFRLRACSDARAALEALIQGHRRSPLLRQARAKLREVRRAPRSACSS